MTPASPDPGPVVSAPRVRSALGGRMLIIDMQEPWSTCRVCGAETPSRWGLPVHAGLIVANDWPGEWAGSPACQACWERHERGELVELPTSEYDPSIHGRELDR